MIGFYSNKFQLLSCFFICQHYQTRECSSKAKMSPISKTEMSLTVFIIMDKECAQNEMEQLIMRFQRTRMGIF